MNNNKGFTLIEVTSALVVSGIVIAGMAAMIHLISKSKSTAIGIQDISLHQMEVRAYLKKQKPSGESICMDELMPILNHSRLKQAVEDADVAAMTFKTELKKTGQFLNFANPQTNAQNYSDLHIINTELEQFRILKRLTGYYTNTAYEFSSAGRPLRPIMYVLGATINTSFVKHGDLNSKPFHSRVNVNLAIDVTDSNNYQLVDCGLNSLARSTAFVESCKSFGKDFEYVHESSNNKGQCYMPVYDPVVAGLGASPTGNKIVEKPTGYTPLRGFLCEGVLASKSSNYVFCTGEY